MTGNEPMSSQDLGSELNPPPNQMGPAADGVIVFENDKSLLKGARCTYITDGRQCATRAFSRGLCRRHGGNYCEVEGCTKDRGRLRYCPQHFRERLPANEAEYTLQDRQDLQKLNRKQQLCKFEGCNKQQVVKTYCVLHARQKLDADVVDAIYKRPSVTCKVEGCNKRYSVKGYCLKHAHEHLNEEDVKAFLIRNNEKGRRNYAKKRKTPVDFLIPEGDTKVPNEQVAKPEPSRDMALEEQIEEGQLDQIQLLPPFYVQPTGQGVLAEPSEMEEPQNIPPAPDEKKSGGTRKVYCKAPGCDKIRVRQGYCTHHLREAGHGDVLSEIYKKSSKKICKSEHCSKHVSLQRYCLTHAHEFVDERVVRDYLDKKKTRKPGNQ